MVTASDSYCWNSETNNKEVVKKCSLLQPQSTLGILAYFRSSIENFRNFTKSTSSSYLSICSTQIMNGSYDQGSFSHVELSEDGTSFLEIHVGSNDTNQYPSCGEAVPYNGLVIDSFSM